MPAILVQLRLNQTPLAETINWHTSILTEITPPSLVFQSLAEAERLASAPRHNAWPFAKPQGRMTTLPNWRKHYADTTLNLTQPSLNVSEGEGRGKRKTDKLLQATYSNMYEMERVRQERERERKMEEEVKKAFKNWKQRRLIKEMKKQLADEMIDCYRGHFSQWWLIGQIVMSGLTPNWVRLALQIGEF